MVGSKNIVKGFVLIIVWAVAVGFMIVTLSTGFVTALAHNGENLTEERRAQLEQRIQEREAEIESRMAERQAEIDARLQEIEANKEERIQKLEDERLARCQERESRINAVMKKITERKTNQVEVFSEIADKVMAFYEEHGFSLDNYDELVANVVDKRGIVEAEIANLEASTISFNCESDDPLKVSEVFVASKESLIKAMKDYKTAVKDLIVGVKSVASADKPAEGEEL